jgi:hypothetical protein
MILGQIFCHIFNGLADEATTLHRYADAAEGAFRRLLQRTYQAVAEGMYAIEPLKDIHPSAKDQKVHGSRSDTHPPKP